MKNEHRIKGGIFFPEDFKKLPKGTIIVIKDGWIFKGAKRTRRKRR